MTPRIMFFPDRSRRIVVALMLTTTLKGDQILTSLENHAPVEVITFDGGAVKFRAPDGTLRSAWVDEIRMMVLDRGASWDEFNQAEQFAAVGEYDRAVTRYKRALLSAPTDWEDLIAARAALAFDAGGQADNAVQHWIIALRGGHGGPGAAARVFPRTLPSAMNGRVERALRLLETALSADPTEEERALLVLLRYEILRRTGDDRTGEAASLAAAARIPPSARLESLFGVQADAIQRELDRADSDDLPTSIDQAIMYCPETMLSRFLMFKGDLLARTARSRRDLLRASWPFLRVAIHFPRDARAPEGLLKASTALARAGLTEKALELVEESLRHPLLTAEGHEDALRRQAQLREAATDKRNGL